MKKEDRLKALLYTEGFKAGQEAERKRILDLLQTYWGVEKLIKKEIQKNE